MSFTNSSQIRITGENTINHVQGNQVNVNLNIGQAVIKRTKYDQFRQVIRGDVKMLKEIHSEEIADWEWEWKYWKVPNKRKARRTTCTIEVYPDRQSKFTAVMYEGEDANCVWEKEFEEFSRTRNPLIAQLFGINRSDVPMLIFHDELIPLANFFNRKSIWMHVYIEHLVENMGCVLTQVWMSTVSGALFSGPVGPFPPALRANRNESIIVPNTIDMLKDDACIRFFINFGSRLDNHVLECAHWSQRLSCLDSLVPATVEDHQSKDFDRPNWRSATHPYLYYLWRNPPNHLPMNVMGGLQFGTVYSPSMEAVARWPRGVGSLWERYMYDREELVEETVLDNGLTRFQLDLTRGQKVHLDVWYHACVFLRGWLSQSSRVFDAIEVAEGKEDFFIVHPPVLMIQSSQHPTATSRTLRNDEYPVKITPPTPIYLFLHPLPMSVLELVSWIEGRPCFWSFDETGQSRMSEEECERWGLPVPTLSKDSVRLPSWPTHVYTALRDWQKARGFDPTTSDWARHMGFPEWEIVGARKVQEEKKVSSSWWEAFVGSGISAVGI
ncbi:hypothetical protein Moror_16281 [Moniliophthora roreri MCA 2997]|uniref:Uncharacterized protein n=2 Tax=Moniliophthora roreri TaxID=221103 RepID=V2WLC9_MONRO|nr:hypothetical protein Moror_16281 [Moniliophthora roreri MCA 2997]KAI3616950.1 hypothetical protein WG66_004165 [Moniliophthora roreri]